VLFRKEKVLCSLGVGAHQDLLTLAKPSFVDYANRHDYDLVLETQPLDHTRPPAWSKVLMIQRLLARYRAVVWIDCDAMIVDPELDVLDAVPRRATIGLVAHRTSEGDQIPNLGLIVVRSNRRARAFFHLLWQQTAFVHHQWWENAAALALFGYTTQAPVELVAPSRYLHLVHFLDGGWNSLSILPAPHPRIVHFAGQTHEVRLREMTRLAAQLGFSPTA